jgi:hypothetical protein
MWAISRTTFAITYGRSMGGGGKIKISFQYRRLEK